MRKWARWGFGLGAIAALAGCDGNGGTGGEGGQGGAPAKPQAIIDIVVDANRDGLVQGGDPADQDHEDEWSAQFGASFLANLDDDDMNGAPDVEDAAINGPGDEWDLSLIGVSPWPEAPDGATGVFRLDPKSAEKVRIWKKDIAGQWVNVAGFVGQGCTPESPCGISAELRLTTDEVRAGTALGIEGMDFRRSLDPAVWTGEVQLTYEIHDSADIVITNDELPDGVDRAKMRVAPWMLFGNLSPFQRVYSNTVMSAFVNGISKAATDGALEYRKINNWNDHWTQDYFQTGWTSVPAPDGNVKGSRVLNARPWGRCDNDSCLPINWLKKNMLGPDTIALQVYNTPHTGDSYDSHGNHDLLPPYTNGAESYPLGRIAHGSGILKETKEFYAAQQVQGPPLVVDTSWLIVGHIDEVFSYVPAATPRGWKLLVGSPRAARQMLEDAQTAGHGSVPMFVGLSWSDNSDAEVTIDEVLADTDLMTSSQQSQADIDGMLDVVKAAVGLADDEIIEIPFLIEKDFGLMVAYNPGTANMLVFGDRAAIPDPFGPVIDGEDMFKTDLLNRLATPASQLGSDGQGMTVYFVDDWDWYHALLGEVHCGSNVDAAPPASAKWWEVVR